MQGMRQRKAAATAAPPKLNFFSDTISELKKVTWLTRREVVYLTGLVLIVTIAVGAVLAVIDFGFSAFISQLFLGGK